jgi:hypothetical protein
MIRALSSSGGNSPGNNFTSCWRVGANFSGTDMSLEQGLGTWVQTGLALPAGLETAEICLWALLS